MAVDYFLKIATIEGESEDHKHGKEIEVLSFSWGESQSGTSSTGSGSLRRKAATAIATHAASARLHTCVGVNGSEAVLPKTSSLPRLPLRI